MKNKQTIECDVYDCKHCNIEEETCKLKSIKVSCTIDDALKDATLCLSFKKNK